jgi:hypothetical protein
MSDGRGHVLFELFTCHSLLGSPEVEDIFILSICRCKIDWKKGKNVTVKTVKKKQKHKASGTTRTIQKTVQSDSFFNFFSPPSREYCKFPKRLDKIGI